MNESEQFVGVIGKDKLNEDYDLNRLKEAKDLGERLAKLGFKIVNGACNGFPKSVGLGAKEVNGVVVGFSFGKNYEEHLSFGFPKKSDFSELFFLTNFFKNDSFKECSKIFQAKVRNPLIIQKSDLIIVDDDGTFGTFNEFLISYSMCKPLIIFKGKTGNLTSFNNFLQRMKPNSLVFEADSIFEVIERVKSLQV